MEQNTDIGLDRDRNSIADPKTLSTAESVVIIIDGLKVIIEGVKALSIIRLIYQISITANEHERELLEQSLQDLVSAVYRMHS